MPLARRRVLLNRSENSYSCIGDCPANCPSNCTDTCASDCNPITCQDCASADTCRLNLVCPGDEPCFRLCPGHFKPCSEGVACECSTNTCSGDAAVQDEEPCRLDCGPDLI